MKRVINSNTETSKWWSKYYNEVSIEELAKACVCDVEDVISAEDLEEYDAKHVAWLVAKPEYSDLLDIFITAELVKEGSEEFIGFIEGDRLHNVEDEIKEYLGLGDII